VTPTSHTSNAYLRSWILVVTMLDLGCRIGEVLNLETTDIGHYLRSYQYPVATGSC